MNDINELVDLPDPPVHPLVHGGRLLGKLVTRP
jgi:hypothetical protein